MNFWDYFSAILAISVIIAAAYYTTRYVGAKSSGISKNRHSNFRVIERLPVAKDKLLMLVAIGNTAYLLGVTNQNISIIDKLDCAGLVIPKEKAQAANMLSSKFQDVLKNAIDSMKGSNKDE